MKKTAFTLAEVLITLAIIGVVAAISIPSVVANTQQKEFQTGLKKAVSVLNSAITMNMAIDGETPYESKNLYHYLGKHMSVMKTNVLTPRDEKGHVNIAFYTTDGMRFEFTYVGYLSDDTKLYLYESPDVFLRATNGSGVNQDNKNGTIGDVHDCAFSSDCAYCGSYGLTNNPDMTTHAPCYIVVDVNGDRKPFPKNPTCWDGDCYKENVRKYGDPSGIRLTDTFPIMITDKQAIPYGQAAQKAMYQAQAKKK